MYVRGDLIGKLGRKCLYGPNDVKNKVITFKNESNQKSHQYYSINEKLNQELDAKSNAHKVRLSLRSLADYRFIFYFSLILIVFKSLSSLPLLLVLFIVCCCFFLHSLFKTNWFI